MQIVTYLTYFAPAISPRMWTLYPLMLQARPAYKLEPQNPTAAS